MQVTGVMESNRSMAHYLFGEGFYEFSFSSLEDLRSVLAVGLWNIGHGSLGLFSWSKDFNPYALKNSNVQVWVRFYGIS